MSIIAFLHALLIDTKERMELWKLTVFGWSWESLEGELGNWSFENNLFVYLKFGWNSFWNLAIVLLSKTNTIWNREHGTFQTQCLQLYHQVSFSAWNNANACCHCWAFSQELIVVLKLITSRWILRWLIESRKWIVRCHPELRELRVALQVTTSTTLSCIIQLSKDKTCCHSWTFLQEAMVILKLLMSGCNCSSRMVDNSWQDRCHRMDLLEAKISVI